MLIERMRKRLAADRASFIEPCLPSPAPKPPTGPNWIHEIKHDGFRLMARRDPVGIRLITGTGNDWTNRYPLVVQAVNHLKVRSCLIDGEVVCSDEKGVTSFQLQRHRRNEPKAFLYAFDLLELNGADLRKVHRYVVETPVLKTVTEEIRAVVETVWPELRSKLPPKP